MGVTHGSAERLAHILEEHHFTQLRRVDSFFAALKDKSPALAIFEMDRGFQAPGLVILTEEDILGERMGRPLKSKKRSDLFIQEVSSLQINDLVLNLNFCFAKKL